MSKDRFFNNMEEWYRKQEGKMMDIEYRRKLVEDIQVFCESLHDPQKNIVRSDVDYLLFKISEYLKHE